LSDFTLTYTFGWSTEPHEIANHYYFDDEDRVQRIEYDYWPGVSPLEVEVLRCEGVVAELVRFPESEEQHTVTTYYYGCDDFELLTTG
jgi:hypothetical protein